MAEHRPETKSFATLTNGPIIRTLAGLSGPMVIGLFSVMAFNLTDTYFVSQLGTRELAAMSFTFPVVSVLYGVSMGLGTGTVSTIARAIGRGETANVRRVCSDSLMLSFVTVFVVAAVGVLTIDPLFRALGAGDDVLPLIHEYMVIWYPGVVFLVVPMVANAAIRASGDTKIPALIMTCGMTLNVILDPVMIFGLLGFPRMELAGAVWATVVARACTMVASIAILHFRVGLLDFSRPKLRSVLASWRQVTAIAIPASLTNVMPSIATGFMTRLIAAYGASAVAAWGASSRISYFVLIPVFALCSGLVPFIGQNWGAEEFGRVRTARGYGYRIALGLGTRDGSRSAHRRPLTGHVVQRLGGGSRPHRLIPMGHPARFGDGGSPARGRRDPECHRQTDCRLGADRHSHVCSVRPPRVHRITRWRPRRAPGRCRRR